MRTFFKALFLNPRATGAVFPSSQYLAQKMVSCIDTNQPGFIVELGPGTGAITKAIISSIPAHTLIAIELAPHLAHQLSLQFPGITVISGSAVHLSALLKDKKPVHTILSSLPLRALSKKNRALIFQEIPKVLSPGGRFIQFTYSMKKDTNFYPQHFKLLDSFLVLRNLPPARVTVFEVM
jgi:phospholipid N-methyltransferase